VAAVADMWKKICTHHEPLIELKRDLSYCATKHLDRFLTAPEKNNSGLNSLVPAAGAAAAATSTDRKIHLCVMKSGFIATLLASVALLP